MTQKELLELVKATIQRRREKQIKCIEERLANRKKDNFWAGLSKEDQWNIENEHEARIHSIRSLTNEIITDLSFVEDLLISEDN